MKSKILSFILLFGASTASLAFDNSSISVPYVTAAPITVGSGIDVDMINQGRFTCLSFEEKELVWLDGAGAQKTNSSIELVSTFKSLAKTLSLKTDYKSKADISLAAISGGASVELNTDYYKFARDEDRSVALVIKAFSDYGRRGLRKYALEETKQELLNRKDFDSFRQQCGTHTVVAEHRTAMIAVVISISEISASSKESLKALYKSSTSIDVPIDVLSIKGKSDFSVTWTQFLKTASKLGKINVTFESLGGAGISDALKLAVKDEPENLPLILSKIAEIGQSFSQDTSGIAEYVIISNTALGLESKINDAEKLNQLNEYYLQLSKIDFALNRIQSYRHNLPELYNKIYIPEEGKLKAIRSNLVASIENCVLRDKCSFTQPPSIDVLYLEDIIQPNSVELECTYAAYSSKNNNTSTKYLSSAALVLKGNARLTQYVSLPNAIVVRLPNTGSGKFSPLFQGFSMQEPNQKGEARFIAQLDSAKFYPDVEATENSVVLKNLQQLADERQQLLAAIYSVEIQAKNGQTIINTVGPAYGGNCPIQL